MPTSTTPTIGEARSHTEGHGYGLVLFASILLLVADRHSRPTAWRERWR